MAGYNQAKIFRSKDRKKFADFIGHTLSQPFAAHIKSENKRLSALFDAASTALTPYAQNLTEQVILSREGITQAHAHAALSHGSLIFGMPLIIEEGFGGMKKGGFTKNYPTFKNDILGNIKGLQVAGYLEPDGGSSTNNRMFSVARFGFISLQIKNDDEIAKGIVFPYTAVPSAFFEVDGADEVLKAGAKLTGWANHDWFHNITAGLINTSITLTDERAPVNKFLSNDWGGLLHQTKTPYGDRRIPTAVKTSGFRNQGTIDAGTNDGVEHWAMRQQKEILEVMLTNGPNPLQDDIDHYIQVLKDTNICAQKEKMKDPAISPAEYAVRMLVSNLVRAVDINHPVSLDAYLGCREAFIETGNDPSIVMSVFNKIYNGKWASRVIFGDGYVDQCAQDYKDRILNMTAHSVTLSFKDSEQSLAMARSPIFGCKDYKHETLSL